MRPLLRGQLDRIGYCALLRNLHAVYAALEAGITRHREHAGLARLNCVPLFRSQSLVDDLLLLHGVRWADEIALVPAAISYVQHLKTEATPLKLAAHAYVRYLGDLSGGQMLARIVAKSLALAPGEGVRFYDFGSVETVAQLAREFRAELDHMTADDAEAQAIVDEACAAFVRHGDLFEALAAQTAAAI
jgi:heme oxygenase